MKSNVIKRIVAMGLVLCWCAMPVVAQNTAIVKRSAKNAALGVVATTTNGKTTITYQGKVVWTGATKGKVSTNSKTIKGEQYLAAYDGDKVLWENVPGAAAKLK